MEQRQLGDASVQQKTNVSSLFETTTTTTTRDAKKDNEKEDQENLNNSNKELKEEIITELKTVSKSIKNLENK